MMKHFYFIAVLILLNSMRGFPQCNLLFSDDFEDGDLAGWQNTNDWTNDNGELKHNLSNEAGQSYTFTDLSPQNLSSGDHEWELCMRNGNWDPSANNYFAFFLITDNTDFTTLPDGYAVGINLTGNDDLLSLFYLDNNSPTPIITSSLDWNSNDDVCIRIYRTSSGDWNLYYDAGSGEVSGGTTNHTSFISGQYMGALFEFTSSRAGQFWADDIQLCSFAPSSANPGDLIITEIMYNPSGNEPDNEWFEVFNTSGTDIDLNGWTIEDNNSSHIIQSSFIIPAGDYKVLGRGGGNCFPNGNYIYTSINLASDDIIKIIDNSTLIDEVDYGGVGWPNEENGESIILNDVPNQDHNTNNSGTNWCISRTSCNGGDVASPGLPNDNCCYFSTAGPITACHNNGTSDNIFDDLYYIAFAPEGSNDFWESTFSISGDINQQNISHSGSSTNFFGPFSIAGGNKTINIVDDADASCLLNGEVIMTPPHCSYDGGNLIFESQFVDPCGLDGPNEFFIFYNYNSLNLNDLAIASGRTTNNLSNIWLGNSYNTSPISLPGYTGSEDCFGVGGVNCYDWLYPSNTGEASLINAVIAELNVQAGCPVFLSVPGNDIIPGDARVAVFLGAGNDCRSVLGSHFDNTLVNLNFSNHCQGSTPLQQYYLVAGTGQNCNQLGYFNNNEPRVSILADSPTGGSNTQSFYFTTNNTPKVISPNGQFEGGPCIPPFSQILPVSLVKFEATLLGNAIQLSWVTSNEFHNNYFIIQRSFGNQGFQEIGEVKGSGTSSNPSSYSFVDHSPYSGTNYYRLKQVDFDGQFHYSPIISADLSLRKNTSTLQPTVSNNNFQLSLNAPARHPLKIFIHNMIGETVYEKQSPPGMQFIQLELGHLPRGSYVLRTSNNNSIVEVHRFFIL